MNAAFIIFFACFGACMAATDARMAIFDNLFQQVQQMGATIMNILSQQVLELAHQASQQLQQIAGSMGGRAFDLMSMIQPMLQQLLSGLQSQVVGLLGNLNLASILGGRININLGAIFQDFYNQIAPAITGLGQHFLNQGLSAVLGAIGGGRIFGDLLSGLSAQIASLVSGAQNVLTSIVGNVTSLAGQVVDASKPHWEQLQEQLVGHGLNVLNSFGNTINDLHGSITSGGR
jgi:phage-related protein